MSKPLSYIVKDSFITVFINGRPVTINNEHENYSAVVEAIKAENWDDVPNLISKKVAIETAVGAVGKGKVVIDDNRVFYNGEEIHGGLVRRMLSMIKSGFDVSRHIKFMENLMENPSRSSVNELWDFMERNDLPISEDGCLLAYKKVRSDFKDIYSGKFDNSPGKIVEMKRNDVDDERSNTCSSGLHFCSYNYLNSYGTGAGTTVVMVKINPRDVVSFPRDYEYAKGRCCRYEVVEEIPDWKDDDSLTQENVIAREMATSDLEDIIITKHSEIQRDYVPKWPFDAAINYSSTNKQLMEEKYFGKTEDELYQMTNTQLVEMWNATQGPYSSILVKFRDKETGVNRIIKLARESNRVTF